MLIIFLLCVACFIAGIVYEWSESNKRIEQLREENAQLKEKLDKYSPHSEIIFKVSTPTHYKLQDHLNLDRYPDELECSYMIARAQKQLLTRMSELLSKHIIAEKEDYPGMVSYTLECWVMPEETDNESQTVEKEVQEGSRQESLLS